jgi:hypothetical protein
MQIKKQQQKKKNQYKKLNEDICNNAKCQIFFKTK